MDGNLHKGHRKRLKALYKTSGFDSMQDHQILELVLFYAIPKKDTNEIAHMLLKKFGGLSKVLDADVNQLSEVKGVGSHSASFIKFLREMITFYENFKEQSVYLADYDSWFKYITEKTSKSNEEVIFMFGISSSMNIIGSRKLPAGIISSKKDFYTNVLNALQIYNANRFIIVHNKPFSESTVSSKEKSDIIKLYNMFKTIEFEFLDYFTINRNNEIKSIIYEH